MRPFRPAWWLPGAHLPTVWGKKFRVQACVHDRLERVTTPDNDHVTLARMGILRAGTPHLLVLHGLEGTLRAKYAHGLLAHAASLGWSGDLLLFRSCDGEPNSARRLYHSGETSDLDFIARRIRLESPGSPLLVCGVSLGGNVLLKWLGELGDGAASLVSAAAAVSVPFDLAAGSRFLERGVSRLYVRHFLSTLRPKAIHKAEQFPGTLDVSRIRRARTFWEFDDAATAPLHGFGSAADYYEQSSSLPYLASVRTPTLLISAYDDPFVPREVLHQVSEVTSSGSAFHRTFTESGGHVGWVEGGVRSQQFYFEHVVMSYFSNHVIMAY